ncbi:MAG: glycosyltransferase [Bacteroidota bacterium]
MAKVFYVGAFNFPIGDAAAARVLSNGKIFRELGYEVSFIGMGQYSRAEDKDVNGEYYYQGFHYYQTDEFRREKTNLLKRSFDYLNRGDAIIAILKKIELQKNDIIIAYHPESIFTSRLHFICKKHAVKFIVDITEWQSPNELPFGRYGPIAIDNELKMRCVYNKVSNKIVISTFLNKHYGLKSNTIILPPLVDSSDMKWLRFNNAANLINKDDNAIKIIYAGTPGKKDALDTMIKAIINLLNTGINMYFYIVGMTMDNYMYSPLFDLIIKYERNIRFLGRHSQEVIPSIYKKVDFSILIREDTIKSQAGFPTKLVESMMAGIPVIINLTSDIGDYIVDGENGFIIGDSSEKTLTKHLFDIASISDEKLQNMKNQAKKCGLDKFDYHNYIEKTKRFIEILQ